MIIHLKDNIYRKYNELTKFLKSDDDGVFYTGHASILVRLNKKKYLFDYINNTNFYRNSWIFFPSQIFDKRLFDVDGIFVSHIHQDHSGLYPRLLLVSTHGKKHLNQLFPPNYQLLIIQGSSREEKMAA